MRRLLLPCLLLAACAGGDHGTGLSDDRFIETIVALRTAALENPGGYAAEKQRIFQDNGVTEEALRAYMESHSDDPVHLASIWEEIHTRLTEPVDSIDE